MYKSIQQLKQRCGSRWELGVIGNTLLFILPLLPLWLVSTHREPRSTLPWQEEATTLLLAVIWLGVKVRLSLQMMNLLWQSPSSFCLVISELILRLMEHLQQSRLVSMIKDILNFYVWQAQKQGNIQVTTLRIEGSVDLWLKGKRRCERLMTFNSWDDSYIIWKKKWRSRSINFLVAEWQSKRSPSAGIYSRRQSGWSTKNAPTNYPTKSSIETGTTSYRTKKENFCTRMWAQPSAK